MKALASVYAAGATAITDYRQQLRPVLEHGATAMDQIFPVADT